ncbi:MAG: hypothetical protein ACYTXY_33485, partial [Nostoc sp.]
VFLWILRRRINTQTPLTPMLESRGFHGARYLVNSLELLTGTIGTSQVAIAQLLTVQRSQWRQ